MQEKIKISELVICEGKYDQIKLSSILDAKIYTTSGFAIFNNSEKKKLFLKLCEKNRVIVLTDSDSGGQQIRALLSKILPKDKVIHLYIPQVEGKEKRKKKHSSQNLLGVEGVDSEILRNLFKPFENNQKQLERKGRMITKVDFYEWGLSGKDNSSYLREIFAKEQGLPPLTANALLEAMNLLGDFETFEPIVQDFCTKNAMC